MLAEMTDNDPKAYAWLSVGANIASTIMPSITGALYEAARAGDRPAAIPCIAMGLLILLVTWVVTIYVKEAGHR